MFLYLFEGHALRLRGIAQDQQRAEDRTNSDNGDRRRDPAERGNQQADRHRRQDFGQPAGEVCRPSISGGANLRRKEFAGIDVRGGDRRAEAEDGREHPDILATQRRNVIERVDRDGGQHIETGARPFSPHPIDEITGHEMAGDAPAITPEDDVSDLRRREPEIFAGEYEDRFELDNSKEQKQQ